MEIRRGDVYWALLEPRSGSEQRGRRPVVVVSHDTFNTATSWRSIIVVPCSTSDGQARRGPTAIPVPRRTGGLQRSCVVLCHQVTTLDRGKLTRRIGTLPKEIMQRIGSGLVLALSL